MLLYLVNEGEQTAVLHLQVVVEVEVGRVHLSDQLKEEVFVEEDGGIATPDYIETQVLTNLEYISRLEMV